MADFGNMELKITADIGDVFGKVDSVKAKLNQLVESQQQLKVKINDLNSSLRLNERELTQANVKLQGLNTTTKAGAAAAATLRKEISQLAGNSKTLGTELNTAKSQLAATTTQIKTQSAALRDAEKSTNSFGGGVGKLYGGLSRLANLIPGLGIGGLVALVGQGAVAAFNAFTNSVGNLAEAQKTLNSALASAEGSVAGEVAQLESLVAIAKDTSLSYAARTEAVKQLNKEYPELHGNINLENINTAAVTDTINKQIDAIKRRSQAKALEKLIDTESEKVEVAKVKRLEKISDETERQSSGFQKGLNKVAQALGAPGLFADRSDAADHFNDVISEGTTRIDVYTKKLNELNTEAAKQGTLFIEPQVKTKNAAKDAAKDIETISDVLTKLQRQIDVIDKDININVDDKAKQKIQAIESTINSLVNKFKQTAKSPYVIDLQAQVRDINLREQFRKILGGLTGEKIVIPLEFLIDEKQSAEKLANKYKTDFAKALQNEKFQFDLDVNPNINTNDLEEAGKIAFLQFNGIFKGLQDGKLIDVSGLYGPELKKLFDEIGGSVDSLKQKFNSLGTGIDFTDLNKQVLETAVRVTTILEPAFTAFFDTLTNGSGNAFQALGRALTGLIKQLIAAALKAIVLGAII
ncbi:MAG: hypothetical protein H0W75_10745, partial [Chitinophagaceae bacterium]|nr:hypothetical protein [Chitinophagaceae bacterium]